MHLSSEQDIFNSPTSLQWRHLCWQSLVALMYVVLGREFQLLLTFHSLCSPHQSLLGQERALLAALQVIHRLGKEINHPDSIYYWAYKHQIPVYCPGLTDGSLGDMLYFHSYKSPGLVIDIVADIRAMNDEAMKAPRKTGILMLGGGETAIFCVVAVAGPFWRAARLTGILHGILMLRGGEGCAFAQALKTRQCSPGWHPLHELPHLCLCPSGWQLSHACLQGCPSTTSVMPT